MKQFFSPYWLYGLFLLPHFLTGQGLDVVMTLRYGGSTMVTEVEPPENGLRNVTGSSYSFGMELRTGKRIGWLVGVEEETITSHKNPGSTEDVRSPFNMVHPYHSSLSINYLVLGAQYNIKVGSGDLSFGLLAGPGRATYSRTWDVLNARVFNDKPDPERISFASNVDISKNTWRLKTAARVQYTYWFSRDLAFSLGAEYTQSNYLGGGVDTGNGLRYELNEREFFPGEVSNSTTPLLYNVNYDRTTLTPDPSSVIRQLRFSIGITGKLNEL